MLDNNLVVTKRDGSLEPFNINKFHKVVQWAVEDTANVSASTVEVKMHMQAYDKIQTADIHETLIKSAAELISEETPNYQFVAARLINFQLRKQVYKQYEPPTLKELVIKNIGLGVYDEGIISLFSDDEWDTLNSFIHHNRDNLMTYAAMEQFRGKYLVQNRTTGKFYETPQMAYILIAAIIFSKYPSDTRMRYIKDYYDAISKGSKSTITLPTPLLAGVRTPTRQFSSCVLIETGDNLSSINECTSAVTDYASQRAGIGLNLGRIRAIGSPIRTGEVFHTGNIPFYKYFFGALRSCSQGGIRGASATVYYPWWHYEAEDLVVLKNNKGTDETRVRHMDYAVQINGFLYTRLLAKKDVSLFSPNDVTDLYEAFFADQDEFARLYEKYEKDTSVRRRTVSAMELVSTMLMERNNTGRIYVQYVDHSNTHSAFVSDTSPVRMSNLCVEVVTPTEPLTKMGRLPHTIQNIEAANELNYKGFRDTYGEISLCTLSSVNWGVMKSPADFEKPCDLAVRALDEILSYQNYPMIAAGVPATNRRNLGVGISNLAFFIAKHGFKYSDGSANDIVHEYTEAMSYYLIQASANLAKEKSPCKWFDQTKYAQGIFPIDTYKKSVDDLVTIKPKMDWQKLKEQVAVTGMRHSTTFAVMPVESSSQCINATNGMEPARNSVTVKSSKHGTLKQVVPEIHKLKNKYEYLWDMPNTRGYLEIAAIIQKWADQSISVNTHYNPNNYPNNQVPMSELLNDLIYAYKYAIKCLYYQNTNDNSGDVFDEEETCSSCTL